MLTLGIIGIVAAITLSVVINKIDEKITVHKLKKFYTTMDQAIKLNEQKNPDNYYTIDHLLDAFTVKKICTGNDTSCAPKQYKGYNGANASWGVRDAQLTKANYAILAGGYLIRYTAKAGDAGIKSGQCDGVYGTTKALSSVCGEVSVDLNGNKSPNTLGKDVFFFYITPLGLVPFGSLGVTDQWATFATCTKEGNGCAAYVLMHETLDYSKYNF